MNADVPDSMVRKQTGELAKHDLQTAGLRLGVDIGNTRTKIALVEDGDIVKLDFMPTLIIEGIKKGPLQFFEDMAHEILRRVGPARRGQFLTGAGIAWFGDVIRGKPMTQAADLLPWHNPAMQRELSEATQTISNVLQCPVTFYGDSEALAIYLGLTGNFASSYLLILGTSTGGGYFGDDGRYVPGVNLVSRIIIDLDPEAPSHTSTGAPGAFQQYSASYGIRRALELVQLPPGSASLSSLPEGEVLRRLLQSDNHEEKKCGERCVEWLSRWLLAAVSDLHTHYRFNNVLLSGGNATEPLGGHIAAGLESLWVKHSEEPLSIRVLSSDTQWPPAHEVALAVAHLAASRGESRQ
jgi:predicted NBD/HSP70 family sugar kinase